MLRFSEPKRYFATPATLAFIRSLLSRTFVITAPVPTPDFPALPQDNRECAHPPSRLADHFRPCHRVTVYVGRATSIRLVVVDAPTIHSLRSKESTTSFLSFEDYFLTRIVRGKRASRTSVTRASIPLVGSVRRNGRSCQTYPPCCTCLPVVRRCARVVMHKKKRSTHIPHSRLLVLVPERCGKHAGKGGSRTTGEKKIKSRGICLYLRTDRTRAHYVRTRGIRSVRADTTRWEEEREDVPPVVGGKEITRERITINVCASLRAAQHTELRFRPMRPSCLGPALSVTLSRSLSPSTFVHRILRLSAPHRAVLHPFPTRLSLYSPLTTWRFACTRSLAVACIRSYSCLALPCCSEPHLCLVFRECRRVVQVGSWTGERKIDRKLVSSIVSF